MGYLPALCYDVVIESLHVAGVCSVERLHLREAEPGVVHEVGVGLQMCDGPVANEDSRGRHTRRSESQTVMPAGQINRKRKGKSTR